MTVSRPDPEQPENAARLRVFIERHAPRQFRDDDGVAHDSAMHVEMLAALDGLLAELDQTREWLKATQEHLGPIAYAEMERALATERAAITGKAIHWRQTRDELEAALVQAKREHAALTDALEAVLDIANDRVRPGSSLHDIRVIARAALVVATEPTLTAEAAPPGGDT